MSDLHLYSNLNTLSTALFSTAYFAPIQYYWHWNRNKACIIEAHENYIKQTWRSRCVIASANGPLQLSIPVQGKTDKIAIKDVRISDHGNWRHLHWNSIESAYNSSPFFEYYSDDIRPFFEKSFVFLYDLNEEIRLSICEILSIDSKAGFTEKFQIENEFDGSDFRNLIHPKKQPSIFDANFIAQPYYQVFQQKLGFLPNMSILDLLFNMGPESILYL